MKRILYLIYFIPAIIALLVYLILAITSGFGSIAPFVWIAILLMFVAAIVMTYGKWYGCLVGLAVGMVLIYMSTQYTGQVINEMPLGIVVCGFYLVSGIVVKKKHSNQ